MQCRHCHVERKGRNYGFSYGTRTSYDFKTSESTGIRTTTIKSNYIIEGKSEEFICDDCVSRQRRKFFLYPIPFVVCASLLALLYLTVPSNGPSWLFWVVISLGFVGFGSFYVWIDSIQHLAFREAGNQIAIDSANEEGKWKDYFLFTPSEIRNMKPIP
jgi:hypothetical protein